jgi:hypothetical protein
MTENKVARKMFALKGDEVTGRAENYIMADLIFTSLRNIFLITNRNAGK